MKTFIENLASYIYNGLAGDEEMPARILPYPAYQENVVIEPPAIYLQQLDDNEAQQFSTFDGELVSYIPVQISIYSQKRLLKKYGSDHWYTAQEMCSKYADKIKDIFDAVKTIEWSKYQIKFVRRVGTSPSLPVKNGVSTYFCPVRYDFYVDRNYKSVYDE